MSTYTHHGTWNDQSRKAPTLRFLESYFAKVDSLDLLSSPSSAFYAPSATLHDTKGNIHTSGPRIWECMQRLFTPFDKIEHIPIEIRVIEDESGRDIIYAQFLTHFRLSGDEEEIVAPRFFVFGVGRAEEGEGLQIFEVRAFWDTGILGRFVTERKRRAESRV